MSLLNFIIHEIFGQGAIFLGLIAMLGLILQRKPPEAVIRGTIMTAMGFFVLSKGTGIITGDSIDGLAAAFGAMLSQALGGTDTDMSVYGTQIGAVMLLAFAANLVFARFTKWKTVFLTGHMLYWIPYVFIAAGVDGGLSGFRLVALAAFFTAAYLIISPNILFPYVKAVTGDSAFAIGHPTTCLSLLAGTIARFTGDKSHSTETVKFPGSLNFLREISITGSLVIAVTYLVMYALLRANGFVPGQVWGYGGSSAGIFTYIFTKSISFGVGVTILLLGVRMLIAEIIPAFKGIAEKVVPGAIPALDCPLLFPYAPNALIIGFIVAMITSTITIILTAGLFPTVIIPLTFTCFFEIGCAAIISNAQGGIRGCVLGTAAAGVVMVLLVGFGSYFFGHTVNNWMLVYGGQDFSLWGILSGAAARLLR